MSGAADDAALADLTGEAQVRLADGASFTLAAAAPDCWNHQVALFEGADPRPDLDDPPDRLMAQHQKLRTCWQLAAQIEGSLHDVAVGATHADAQHLHQRIVGMRQAGFVHVLQPGAAFAGARHHCAHAPMLAWAAMTIGTTWSSGDVQTNGIRLHYYRTGDDKPTLVLAHGATDDGLCWSRVARALESEYDLIMPDARGHGLSEAPEQGYSPSDHAADLAGLIKALGLVQPIVGGHSMGAAATLRLVADHPDLVRAAFLEDPGFRAEGAPPRQSPANSIRGFVEEARTSDRETLMARGRESNLTWDESEFGPWADAKLRVSDAFLKSFGTPVQEWREVLPRVQRPLLLITSDPEKGSIVTPETAREAQHLLPSLQVVRLDVAGHNIRREQFDRFVSCVREFLAAN